MNQDVIDDLIAIIDNELGEPLSQRPDGFGITSKEYARHKGCTYDIARKMLEAMVETGKWTKQRMIDGLGTAPFVYYPVDKV